MHFVQINSTPVKRLPRSVFYIHLLSINLPPASVPWQAISKRLQKNETWKSLSFKWQDNEVWSLQPKGFYTQLHSFSLSIIRAHRG